MKKSFFKKSLSTLVVFLMLAGSANAQSINWTPPSGPPLGNNVPAPVNVGDIFQTKIGGLGVENTVHVGRLDDGQVGDFFSHENSYLYGMTAFQDRTDGSGPNFLVSFLQSFFFDDVHVGDASYPTNLSVDGGFRFSPKDSNGNPIPYQPGYVLTVDDSGNASWTDSSGLPSCEVGQIPEYQQIDDDNYAWGCASVPLPPVCADGQVLTYDTGMSQWACTDVSTLGGGFTPPLCAPGQVYGVDSLGNWGCLSVGGGGLPACSIGEIIKVDDNGVWSCDVGGGGTNIPDGTFNGQILAWDATTSAWVPSKAMQALGGSLILGGAWPGGGGPTAITIGSTLANGPTVKVPLNENTSKGKFLSSLSTDGQLGWNPYLKMYPLGGIFNILELSAPDGQTATFLNNGWTILRDELFLTGINQFPDDESQLARLCIDVEGADGVLGTPGTQQYNDNGQVYKCKGESGFLYTYLGINNYENSDPANTDIDNYAYYYEDEDGNPQYMQDVQTNGNGRSFIREWVVPDEIYSIDLQIASGAGGGGGGGAGHYNSTISLGHGGGGGGGGGSGYMAPFFDIPVTPGETLCIFTGRGGKGGYGVAKKRNRPLVQTIANPNLDAPNNYVAAKTGQNGGNSFVARPPVGGDCSDVDPNNPILPQGAGIVIGGFGGKGGESNIVWTDAWYQPLLNGVPDGPAQPPDGVIVPSELEGRRGGSGGSAGYHGQTYGYNGSSGMSGFLNSQNPPIPTPGAGGNGGAGGASGGLNVQIGGAGADNFYAINIDANKDGSYVTGRNGPTNAEGEKARGLGDHGKTGTTLFVNQNFPGGGSGGGGASRGYITFGTNGGNVTNAECQNPPFGFAFATTYYEGDLYGPFGGTLPSWVDETPPPNGYNAWGYAVSWNPLMFGVASWVACNAQITYSTENPSNFLPKYTMLDFDGDGITDNNAGIGQPREQWGDGTSLVRNETLNSSINSITTHMTASGYTQNEINAYLDNLCMEPFQNGDSWTGFTFAGTAPEYKITALKGCGGDGGPGGHGNVMAIY